MKVLAAMLAAAVNHAANATGALMAYPIAVLPGWLSLTVFSALLGLGALVIYKHTSNQRAIGKIRNGIRADLLAVRLFKGNIPLIVNSQVRVLISSFRLLGYSVVPLLVMVIPVSLILIQLGSWYQARPADIRKHPVVVRMKLKAPATQGPEVRLIPNADILDLTGPVQVVSRNELFWKVQPLSAGQTRLRFQAGEQVLEKRLSAGNGFMRVSSKRPGMHWPELFLHPLEPPMDEHSVVESIEILYPRRKSYICGTDWWLIYVFFVSMVFAVLFRPVLKVRL